MFASAALNNLISFKIFLRCDWPGTASPFTKRDSLSYFNDSIESRVYFSFLLYSITIKWPSLAGPMVV